MLEKVQLFVEIRCNFCDQSSSTHFNAFAAAATFHFDFREINDLSRALNANNILCIVIL